MVNLSTRISILIFLILFSVKGIGQDVKIADSLKFLYHNTTGREKQLLNEIAYHEVNPDSILKYSSILIEISLIDSSLVDIYTGYLQKGNAWMLKGDMDTALEYYFKSLQYATKLEDQAGVGQLHISIADLYAETSNYKKAMESYKRGIEILRQTDDSLSLAMALLNAGDSYVFVDKLDSALILTLEAEKIFHEIDYPVGQAYGHGNIGVIYAHRGEKKKAESNINTAINILEDYEDYSAISIYLSYMSDIYNEQGDTESAFSFANRSLELAKNYGLKDQMKDASLILSNLHEQKGNNKSALRFYKDYILYRDSVINLETEKKIANLHAENEIRQAQATVDILEKEKIIQKNRNLALTIILGLSILILAALFWFYKQITKEKNKSDKLLLNILPYETAEELKEHGFVKAKRFESVSVMFADIKEFTKVSEKLTPDLLVKAIDFYFSKFDEIIEKYGLEKIKTIGDAYMCAGGVPDITRDHAIKMVEASIEILDFVNQLKDNNPDNVVLFDIRIGINTGPIVAGVVGTKKFAYDIYGDTVNIASRLESNSIPGKINISENTYNLIKAIYNCEYRGEVSVKNKGMMKMYFIKEKRNLAKNPESIV